MSSNVITLAAVEAKFLAVPDFNDYAVLNSIIQDLYAVAEKLGSKNQANSYRIAELKEFKNIGYFLFRICSEHQNKMNKMLEAKLRATACEFFILSVSSARHVYDNVDDLLETFSLDTLDLLVRAHARTAKSFMDASKIDVANSFFNKSLRYWSHVEKRKQTSNFTDVGFDLMDWKCKTCLMQQKFTDALKYAQEAARYLNDSKIARDAYDFARSMFNIGTSLFKIHQFENSIPWLLLSISSMDMSNSKATEKQARTLRTLAQSYMNLKSYEEALNTIQQSITLFNTIEVRI
jgi:tetratricopeptide (TPR) repeat protein